MSLSPECMASAQSATLSPLPVVVATRKKMMQLLSMMKSFVFHDCREENDLMLLWGVDSPIYTTIDTHDLHIHKQGTS